MDHKFLPPPEPPLPPGRYTVRVKEAEVIFNHKTYTDKLVTEVEIEGRTLYLFLDPVFQGFAVPGSFLPYHTRLHK